MVEDTWAPLYGLGYPGYYISIYGEIVSEKTDQKIQVQTNQHGQRYVQIYDTNKVRRTELLSRLVAKVFVQKRSPEEDTVMFKDHNPDNCKADNLVWRERSYAIRYKRQHKLQMWEDVPRLPVRVGPLGGTWVTFDSVQAVSEHFGVLYRDVLYALTHGVDCKYMEAYRIEYI